MLVADSRCLGVLLSYSGVMVSFKAPLLAKAFLCRDACPEAETVRSSLVHQLRRPSLHPLIRQPRASCHGL